MDHSNRNPSLVNRLEHRQQVQELARGYHKAKILLTCVELGVFEVLAGRSATAQTVADMTQTSIRGMELLLNAAASLGLLEKHDSNFSNSEIAEAWLIPGRDGSLSQSLLVEKAFYTRWGHLAEAVRTGKRPEDNRQDERAKDWVKNFIYGLYDAARPFAPIIAE